MSDRPGRIARRTGTGRAGIGARPLWTCPKCGHRFVTANMWHSCRVVDLDSHFCGKPGAIRVLFDAWRRYVERFGAITVVPQKTRICFQTRVRFAGAIVRGGHVECSFWLRRRVADLPALFGPVEVIPPGYFIYRFNLTDGAQLRTRGLRAMVREAYALGLQLEPVRGRGRAVRGSKARGARSRPARGTGRSGGRRSGGSG